MQCLQDWTWIRHVMNQVWIWSSLAWNNFRWYLKRGHRLKAFSVLLIIYCFLTILIVLKPYLNWIHSSCMGASRLHGRRHRNHNNPTRRWFIDWLPKGQVPILLPPRPRPQFRLCHIYGRLWKTKWSESLSNLFQKFNLMNFVCSECVITWTGRWTVSTIWPSKSFMRPFWTAFSPQPPTLLPKRTMVSPWVFKG